MHAGGQPTAEQGHCAWTLLTTIGWAPPLRQHRLGFPLELRLRGGDCGIDGATPVSRLLRKADENDTRRRPWSAVGCTTSVVYNPEYRY